MNLILLFPDDFASDGTVRLTGRRARHVHEVHRARVGDSLTVGRVNGQVGKGTVLFVEPDEVRLSVCLSEDPPPPTGLDLLLAMPRPKVLRRVLQSAASLGARRIVLLAAQRVEKSYFDTPFLEPGEVERNLVLGLEQARDTVLPEVVVRRRFRPFVEDELEGYWPAASCARLLAHPAADAQPGGLRRRQARVPGGARHRSRRRVDSIRARAARGTRLPLLRPGPQDPPGGDRGALCLRAGPALAGAGRRRRIRSRWARAGTFSRQERTERSGGRPPPVKPPSMRMKQENS